MSLKLSIFIHPLCCALCVDINLMSYSSRELTLISFRYYPIFQFITYAINPLKHCMQPKDIQLKRISRCIHNKLSSITCYFQCSQTATLHCIYLNFSSLLYCCIAELRGKSIVQYKQHLFAPLTSLHDNCIVIYLNIQLFCYPERTQKIRSIRKLHVSQFLLKLIYSARSKVYLPS